ncbi:MAG TPA: molybdopterin-dependent oxidoreductase, partial [Rectinemataceae bacterium]|nr:molybdopterin-dependent oxidoreductase [Rectinemataceae bacterium]
LRTGQRGSGQFKAVSWDEALGHIHDRLSSTIERFGNESVLCLSSAGSTGALHNTEVLSRRFLNAIGGCTVLEGSYSSNAANHALKKVFGLDYRGSGFDAATMEDARLIILWGANIVEARLGAELPARLFEARRQGVPVISIDPRKTKTAEVAGAEWIAVRPGTDLALMYAILFVLDVEGLLDLDRINRLAEGFEDILDHVRGIDDGIAKTPLWASALCGVDEKRIGTLARRWHSTKPVMLIPGYSIQRTSSGEEVMRLCIALQLATGNFGVVGGSTGSLNNRLPGLKIKTIDEGDGTKNPRIPLLRWPDAILRGQSDYPSSVHAVYSAGGNFLNQGADLKKNVAAFGSLDFSVSHELFMTPTARYCDVVLPAASPLQKEDIGLSWSGNYALYKPKILPYE